MAEPLIPAEAVRAVADAMEAEDNVRTFFTFSAMAKVALAALAEQGYAITDACGCGQPVGVCPCGDPRCWRCDPWVEPLPVPCGVCLVCAGRIVGGDGECYAASQECDHKPAPQPSGTIQDARPARDGMSGRSDDPRGAASLSEPQPWKGNAVVLIDGQQIPIRADLTVQPAAWSITAHLNPADELYLPLGSCVIRLPDGREGAAIVTSVQNGVCGSLSGVGPPPTSQPLPAEFELIELTHEEWETARDNDLTKLGCTLAELEGMARTGDYATPRHRALWLAIKPVPREGT